MTNRNLTKFNQFEVKEDNKKNESQNNKQEESNQQKSEMSTTNSQEDPNSNKLIINKKEIQNKFFGSKDNNINLTKSHNTNEQLLPIPFRIAKAKEENQNIRVFTIDSPIKKLEQNYEDLFGSNEKVHKEYLSLINLSFSFVYEKDKTFFDNVEREKDFLEYTITEINNTEKNKYEKIFNYDLQSINSIKEDLNKDISINLINDIYIKKYKKILFNNEKCGKTKIINIKPNIVGCILDYRNKFEYKLSTPGADISKIKIKTKLIFNDILNTITVVDENYVKKKIKKVLMVKNIDDKKIIIHHHLNISEVNKDYIKRNYKTILPNKPSKKLNFQKIKDCIPTKIYHNFYIDKEKIKKIPERIINSLNNNSIESIFIKYKKLNYKLYNSGIEKSKKIIISTDTLMDDIDSLCNKYEDYKKMKKEQEKHYIFGGEASNDLTMNFLNNNKINPEINIFNNMTKNYLKISNPNESISSDNCKNIEYYNNQQLQNINLPENDKGWTKKFLEENKISALLKINKNKIDDEIKFVNYNVSNNDLERTSNQKNEKKRKKVDKIKKINNIYNKNDIKKSNETKIYQQEKEIDSREKKKKNLKILYSIFAVSFSLFSFFGYIYTKTDENIYK